VGRLGENASAGAKSTLEILNQILLDGQVRADELGRFLEALGRMNGMQETQAAAVEDALKQSADALSAQTGVIKSLVTVFQDLKNQNNELKAQLGTVQ
jgi:hypothetical protein